ncbi:ATP-binding protein [Parabacteroides sp.]
MIGNEARLQDITVEDLLRSHPSRPSNKLIADIFYKAGFIENWGRGTQRIIDKCMAEGLSTPVYKYKMGFLYLTFSHERINELAEIELKVYDLISLDPHICQSDLAIRLALMEQYFRKIIKQLKDKGAIERVGVHKNGYCNVKIGK